ncbi:hypothetical protein EJF36_05270 [Bacillus sp. HMF5848]|uniref:AAA family ATPase n=1 Tax=Bacillus sp. HMF5848 TaxID=2495421 RepID=UPI000F79D5DE|nr:AAA family ATPase [Bacillus sp. HMF5848]RSK26317.1 hypothetical protein EJF36_05270 [Bacillus sp. HMF5848]
MKIKELHIYGFGKLVDVHISLNSNENIQAFYGRNEAGKSTIMAFILGILYGFPTKQQNESRYEPKTGGSYGGRIVFHHEQAGEVVVERVRGKANGDVTVYYEDGRRAGESELQAIVQGMTKGLYQSIFAFNIHSLQGISQIDGERIGQYLFSSSLTGTDSLERIDTQLTKQMDMLYKPAGKKPKINQQLQAVKQAQQIMIKKQQEHGEYTKLQQDIYDAENLLAELQAKRRQLIDDESILTRALQIAPTYEEYLTISAQAESLEQYEDFPVDALERFEKIQTAEQSILARITSIDDSRQELLQQYNSLQINDNLLRDEAKINYALEGFQIINMKQQQISELNYELEKIDASIHHIKNAWQISEDEENILTHNTSRTAKENAKVLVTKYEHINRDLAVLKERQQECIREVDESISKLNVLESYVLDDELEQSYRDKLTLFDRQSDKQSEARYVEESLQRVITRRKAAEKKERTQKRTALIGVIIGFLLSLFTYFQDNQVLFLSMVFVAIICLGLYVVVQVGALSKTLREEEATLKRKLVSLNEIDTMISRSEYEHLQQQVKRGIEIRNQLDWEKTILEKKQAALEAVEQQVFEAKEACETIEREIVKFWSLYNQAYDASLHVLGNELLDFLNDIDNLKQLILTKQQTFQKQEKLIEQFKEFENTITLLKDLHGIDEVAMDQIIFRLKQEVNQEKENVMKKQQLEEKINELNDMVHTLEKEQSMFTESKNALFHDAKANDEDEFRRRCKDAKRFETLTLTLHPLKSQISRVDDIVVQSLKSTQEWELQRQLEHVQQQLRDVLSQEEDLQTQLSQLRLNKRRIVEDGSLSEATFKVEQEAALLWQHTKEWSKYALAKHYLTKAIGEYRNTYMPQLLAKTNEYFVLLTNKHYMRVFAPEEFTSFIVERQDGVHFAPNELSQATAEQLYVALRLALADVVTNNISFPIIVDDSFVNFDDERLQNAIHVLRQVAANHQVLLFTCHEHVAASFKDNELVNVEDLQAKIV